MIMLYNTYDINILKSKIMKVLAIGAHPDDIEIFMFGILMCYKMKKNEIYLAVATDGAAGNVLIENELANVRKSETKKALKDLGDPYFFNLPDGGLNFAKNEVNIFKEYITNVLPDLIITHSPEDYHSDHRALSFIVKEATGFKCPIIYTDTLMGVNFLPDYYVEITPHFELKKNAIMKHKSQNPERFLQATILLNRFRSAQCNAPKDNYAEAFKHEKRFPFADIRFLLPNAPKICPFYENNPESFI
jgi:LmbE family N-acetylglucosaminyl deacetylase